MATSTDDAGATLLHLGWSAVEMSYRTGYELAWQVDARRGGQTILARAKTQAEAWQVAATSALDIE